MASQTVLITGASHGFGREFARRFAQDNYNQILVARTAEELEDLKQELSSTHPELQFDIIPMDLARPEAAQELYDTVQQKGLQVDMLVNNAGHGMRGKFTEVDFAEEVGIINLNIVTLVGLTKFFGQDMVARGSGRILQLGSVASFMPNPLLSVYGATKAFVHSYSEALQNELEGTGVTLTILAPGASDTEFFIAADATDTKAAQSAGDPKQVVEDGYAALMAGEKRVISGFMNKMTAMTTNYIPDSWAAAASRKQFEKAE